MDDFIKYIKNNIGLYYDVIFDKKLILISINYRALEPEKQVTLIYPKKQADS